MIQKPAGYDDAQAFTGEYERLTPGGHICIIKSARQETDRNGNPYLAIAFDIAQGDPQAGFFTRQYNAKKKQDTNAKWPANGVYRQGLGEKSASYLKGMITCIMESNPGYVWKWDETTLPGKMFGGVFGIEEYRGSDGKIRESVKCRFIRSVDAVKAGIEAPEAKRLTNNSNTPAEWSNPGYIPPDMSETDEDLPF